jgi:hypothetical protein
MPHLLFHDETDLALLRAQSPDRPFRDARNADQISAWQTQLRDHAPRRPLAFKSCAVVGSSGNLLVGAPRGALIDGHDAVFRVNHAPTRGYEEYVGRRTAVWVSAWGANSSTIERHFKSRHRLPPPPSPSSVPVQLAESSRRHHRSGGSGSTGMGMSSGFALAETIIFCQPSDRLGQCWRSIGSASAFGNASRLSPLVWLDLRTTIRKVSGRTSVGTFPSTGALAVYAALAMCGGRPLTLFGFGNSSTLGSSCRVAGAAGTAGGTPCDRYYALGPGDGLERCVHEGARPCPPGADYEHCTRWRSSRGTIDQYARGTIWGSSHDFQAEWAWLESLVASGQASAPCTDES